MKAKLIALGDSIVKGVLLNQEFNGTTHYALADNNIVDLVAQQLHLESTNLGKMGCTIDVGERILDRHIAEFKEGGYVILSYGGNDCDYNWRAIAQDPSAEHHTKTPISLFEKTYARIIAKVREAGLIPLVMSLPAMDAERYYKFFTSVFSEEEKRNVSAWLKDGYDAIWAAHELYNDAVKRVALAADVQLLDVSMVFGDAGKCLCIDGTHPNTLGQSKIAAAITRAMQ